MAAPKRPTHVVVHKNLYLNDPALPANSKRKKLVHVKAGSYLALTEKQAKDKRISSFVSKMSSGGTTDLTKDPESNGSNDPAGANE